MFQRALDLMVAVYEATESFARQEMYGLGSQLRRAAVSVVSHIAEGQGRLTFGEWRQMLSQTRGSLYEVQAQVIAANRLGFLTSPVTDHLEQQSRMAGRELAGLITWVRKRETQTKRSQRATAQATSNQ